MDFDNSQPIYTQIIDDFKKRIIRGELKHGDKIPSQREYAQTVRVNPNTVQRAYREMESMNIVETLRGQGTFITLQVPMQEQMQKQMAERLIEQFIREMRAIGYHGSEIIDLVKGGICVMEEGEKID